MRLAEMKERLQTRGALRERLCGRHSRGKRHVVEPFRRRKMIYTARFATSALIVAALWAQAARSLPAGEVTQQRILAAANDPGNWLVHGGTFNERRFSPARLVNRSNVQHLGLGWYRDIPSPDGLNAAPIAVDGVVYISAPFSVVYAIDIRTGALRWSYNPHVNLDTTLIASFTARVNRGVAVWGGKVLVETADCRLIALNATTGALAWQAQVCNVSKMYTMAAAPVVADGLVFVGPGVGDLGARGFVQAFDARTGRPVWRFYTVPTLKGPQAAPYLEAARATWKGAQRIAGGNVWDDMTYDPTLDLLYFGSDGPNTNRAGTEVRLGERPSGGDDLYTESILAVRARTGKFVWYRQTTPQDNFDFNDDFHIVIANLLIHGVMHRAIMTAPKDGFYYVLDARTGKPLTIGALTRENWALRVDPATGNPTLNPEALPWKLASGRCFTLYPGGWGAHSTQDGSYSPIEGLVYLPVTNVGNRICRWKGGIRTTETVSDGRPPGELEAWDPVQAKTRWIVPRQTPYNGGTMVTASGLVFEGTGAGHFQAIDASTGKVLWSDDVGEVIQGSPITVVIDNRQYVIVVAGEPGIICGVSHRLCGTDAAEGAPARVLAFELEGHVHLPPKPPDPVMPAPPNVALDPEVVARGGQLYNSVGCMLCHGTDVDNGHGHSAPNLLYIPRAIHNEWDDIVRGGILRQMGMLPFAISEEESNAIHEYVISEERSAYARWTPRYVDKAKRN
jgi:quinohemoprotein ethanol dehydrogenase